MMTDMPRSLQMTVALHGGRHPSSTHVASTSDNAGAAHSCCMYECLHAWLMNFTVLSMS